MITGLIEVILYVEDMNTQVAFYRDKLGLLVEYPADLADYSREFWVLLNAGACKLALHGGGSRRFGADTPKLVFGVNDIAQARQTLQAPHCDQRSALAGARHLCLRWCRSGRQPFLLILSFSVGVIKHYNRFRKQLILTVFAQHILTESGLDRHNCGHLFHSESVVVILIFA
ncbi:MAG: hypothetical protein R3A44_40955 [Caldilineaceae bacterium]